jgi:hypothetical protein
MTVITIMSTQRFPAVNAHSEPAPDGRPNTGNVTGRSEVEGAL